MKLKNDASNFKVLGIVLKNCTFVLSFLHSRLNNNIYVEIQFPFIEIIQKFVAHFLLGAFPLSGVGPQGQGFHKGGKIPPPYFHFS